MAKVLFRLFRSLEKTSYVKVPIVFPVATPPVPLDSDYEILFVNKNVNNRELVQAFRQLSFAFHPANDTSVVAAKQYAEIVEAYDRIALYRMAENGVPQPYSEAYYPPSKHTKVIKDFIDENAFWTPHVWENYTQVLFLFWATFGVFHSLFQVSNPFLIN